MRGEKSTRIEWEKTNISCAISMKENRFCGTTKRELCVRVAISVLK